MIAFHRRVFLRPVAHDIGRLGHFLRHGDDRGQQRLPHGDVEARERIGGKAGRPLRGGDRRQVFLIHRPGVLALVAHQREVGLQLVEAGEHRRDGRDALRAEQVGQRAGLCLLGRA
jgi:hypothetical protein